MPRSNFGSRTSLFSNSDDGRSKKYDERFSDDESFDEKRRKNDKKDELKNLRLDLSKTRERRRSRSSSSRSSFSHSYSSRSSSSESLPTNYDDLDQLDEELFNTKSRLSLNVVQTFITIRNAKINIQKMKKKYKNLKLEIEFDLGNEDDDLKRTELEELAESILVESINVIPLVEIVYGVEDHKTASAYVNLAQVYLDYKNMPNQAKQHCQKAWSILFKCLKDDIHHNYYKPAEELTEASEAKGRVDVDSYVDREQMILNYVYGRACTISLNTERALKTPKTDDEKQDAQEMTKEAEDALEKALECFEEWESRVKDYESTKQDRNEWKQKILLALAKYYATSNNFANALVYYDKLLDHLEGRHGEKIKHRENEDGSRILSSKDRLLIEVYRDKAKIEQSKENFDRAADSQLQAIKIAKQSQSALLVADCVLQLAKIYENLDDMTSSANAEDKFKECIDAYVANLGEKSDRALNAKRDLAKFYINQQRFEDARSILSSLIVQQVEHYGDYNIKLNQTNKLLCSVLLKLNDMPSAATYLQASYDIEVLNYGNKDQRTKATKETLDNLKKNPDVKLKLKVNDKSSSEKRSFSVIKKVDYTKLDKTLYADISTNNAAHNTVQNATHDDHNNTSISKKITPIK